MLIDRILGDSSRLPFHLLLSLRSQLIRNPLATLLAVLTVAASVALASSVEVASRSVSSALERSINAVAGSTEIEITAAGQGVPEEFVEAVRVLPGIRSASPVIQQTFRVVREGRREEPLRVVGLDLLYDREVRDYRIAESGIIVRDHVRLVASGDSIVLSDAMARKLSVADGDRVSLRSTRGVHTVTVRGILQGGLAQAYGGSLGVMDVFALQHLLDLGPIVNRIDISLEPGSDVEAMIRRIQSSTSDGVTVRRSELRANVVSPILAAYSFGIWAITMIGILVALCLTYAVISIMVDRRVVEFALLRTAGMDAKRARQAVIVDALVIAFLGTTVGLVLAAAYAGKFVVLLSTAAVFYQEVDVEPASFSLWAVGLGMAVGVPMAMVACAEPARRAGRREPLAILRRWPEGGGTSPRLSGAAVAGWVAALGLVGAVFATSVRPGIRLGVAVVGGAAVVWALGSTLLPWVLPRVQVALASSVPRIGVLIGASLGDRPGETGVTIAIWATVVAAAVSLFSSLNALGASMDEFISGENGPTAIMAFNVDAGGSVGERLPIDPTIVSRIEKVPGVRDAWASQSTTLLFRGEEVPLDDYDVDKLTRNGGLTGSSNDPEESIAALRRGEILASDSFLKHFDVQVGDEIELQTVAGPQSFRVGGSSRSFSGPKGKLFVESEGFVRWFRSPGALAIILWVDGDPDEVLARVSEVVDGMPLVFRHGEAFQRQARRSIERFSALLMLPLAVVGIIGVIGLSNLLVGNVVARQRDLALIRASGGTHENVMAVVALSSGAIALVGTGGGVALGIAWAIVIRDAISEFLGWQMAVSIQPATIASLVLFALGAAIASAGVPLLFATRRRDWALLSEF